MLLRFTTFFLIGMPLLGVWFYILMFYLVLKNTPWAGKILREARDRLTFLIELLSQKLLNENFFAAMDKYEERIFGKPMTLESLLKIFFYIVIGVIYPTWVLYYFYLPGFVFYAVVSQAYKTTSSKGVAHGS